MKSEIKVDGGVIFTELNEKEAVLLHLGTKKYFALNETGISIWKYAEKGISIYDLVSKIKEDYAVSNKVATESIIDFLDELISEKLVMIED
jgi:hypothetical protein